MELRGKVSNIKEENGLRNGAGDVELAVICFAHSDHKALMEKMRAEGFNPMLLHEIDLERDLVPERLVRVISSRRVTCIAVAREERFGAERFLERWHEEQRERVEALSTKIWPYFFAAGCAALLAGAVSSFLDASVIGKTMFFFCILLTAAGVVVKLGQRVRENEDDDSEEAEIKVWSEHDERDGHNEHSDGHA